MSRPCAICRGGVRICPVWSIVFVCLCVCVCMCPCVYTNRCKNVTVTFALYIMYRECIRDYSYLFPHKVHNSQPHPHTNTSLTSVYVHDTVKQRPKHYETHATLEQIVCCQVPLRGKKILGFPSHLGIKPRTHHDPRRSKEENALKPSESDNTACSARHDRDQHATVASQRSV